MENLFFDDANITMRLTRFSDYALRVLIYLALHREGLSTIREIADAYSISKNHLMKVVHKLVRLGYIEAVRGQNGGLRLALPQEKINLGELLRHTEEDWILAECFSPDNRCVITPTCELKGALKQALDAFMAVLDQYSLDQLIRDDQKTMKLLKIQISPR